MKNKILTLFAFILGICLSSCGREEYTYQTSELGEGKLDLSALTVSVEESPLTRAAASEVQDFIVRVFERNTNVIERQWFYSEMPEIATLKAGSYRIDVISHKIESAEFDKPYYKDSKEFDIRANEVTSVGKMMCKMSSVKVTIEYDTDLALLLGDDVEVKVQLGTGVLVFKKGELRAGYFEPVNDLNILTAELSGTIDGEKQTILKAFSDVKAGEHRAIRYTLKNTDTGANTESGGVNPSLQIDATCIIYDKDVQVGVEEGVIEDDEVKPNPEPEQPDDSKITIEGVGFDIAQPIDIPAEGKTVQVDINSTKGIKNLFVTIDSETLTPELLEGVNLASSFDLANPGNLEEGLAGLGFPVGNQVIGQTYLQFDITQFTPLLGIYGAATHKFIIKVVDSENNQLTRTLTLISK